MRLSEFSVRQTVLVNVLFVVCLVGGLRALQLTEVEYFHDITTNEVSIVTFWAGASAEEVELLVTARKVPTPQMGMARQTVSVDEKLRRKMSSTAAASAAPSRMFLLTREMAASTYSVSS